MQVLSEPGVCNTPTQKPAVRENPESVTSAPFAVLEGGKKEGQKPSGMLTLAG